jgi:hypothetical protein
MTSHRIVILPDKYPLSLPAAVPQCVWAGAEWAALYKTGEPAEVTKDTDWSDITLALCKQH